MNVSFYPKTNKGEKPTTIYALCYDRGNSVKIYLPLRLKPSQWDNENQRCRKNFPNYSEANSLLIMISNELKRHHLTSLSLSNDFNPQELKDLVSQVTNKKDRHKRIKDFTDYFEEWITNSSSFKTPSTLTIYRTTLKHLNSFSESARFKLSFDKIDFNFYEKFTDYLLKTSGHNNNTIGKYVKTLKTFLNWATDTGVNSNRDFTKFKVFKNEIEVVFLEQVELEAIRNLDLNTNLKLDTTRDIFLFECETGLRYSDLLGLKKENIKNTHIIFWTQKTTDQIRIPLSPVAKSILDKYKSDQEKPLPVKSNQKMNEDLKVIARLAGIDSPTTIIDIRGVRQNITKPKWEFISTHTARRTFVTNALEKGIRPEIVMEITGHKDPRTMRRYQKITDKVVENEFSQLWK